MPAPFEADVLQKARELMADFHSLTCHLHVDEENRAFQEFVLMRLAELTLSVESLRSVRNHTVDVDARTYWTPDVPAKPRKRMSEFEDLAPDIGGEG